MGRKAGFSPGVIMQSMQTLRNAHWITRLVLVWFALFIGAAVATPLVKPEPTSMVCSAMGGMKLVNLDADQDSTTPSALSLDCPLCMPVAAPAPATLALPVHIGLAHALHPLESARLASLLGAPWHARAPPSPSI